MEELKLELIKLIYGYHYNIYPIYVSTDDVGHSGCTRNRVYIILAHKKRVRMLQNPYRMYKKIRKTIKKHIFTRPSDYLISPQNEILLDAAEIARMRKYELATPLKCILCLVFFFTSYIYNYNNNHQNKILVSHRKCS